MNASTPAATLSTVCRRPTASFPDDGANQVASETGGGCATPDPFDFGNAANSTAQDCTAISHAASVGCNAGRCTVQSCDPGYVAVSDAAGDRCVRSQVEAIKLQKYRL